MGSPLAQLRTAVDRFPALLRVERISSVYRTEPVGYEAQPDFLNLVCSGRTELAPLELLAAFQRIEEGMGREKSVPNGPRPIDIDLLAYGDLIIDSPDLTLPHPRLHLRAFVLVPLLEIAPEWRHPVLAKTPAELLTAAATVAGVERLGPLLGGD